MRAEAKDGHYGVLTVGDGSSGYGGATGFQVKHSNETLTKDSKGNITNPDGWLGKRELTKLFLLAGMRVRVTD